MPEKELDINKPLFFIRKMHGSILCVTHRISRRITK